MPTGLGEPRWAHIKEHVAAHDAHRVARGGAAVLVCKQGVFGVIEGGKRAAGKGPRYSRYPTTR